jgi:hypothetical protein
MLVRVNLDRLQAFCDGELVADRWQFVVKVCQPRCNGLLTAAAAPSTAPTAARC